MAHLDAPQLGSPARHRAGWFRGLLPREPRPTDKTSTFKGKVRAGLFPCFSEENDPQMVDFPYPLSMGGGKWVWVESWVIGERADHLLGKLSILAVQPWDMQTVTFLVCASGFFSLCFGLQLNSTRTSLNTSSTTMTYWQHWWPVEEGFPNKRHHGFCVWAIYDHPCQIYVDPDHFKYRSSWTSLTPQKKNPVEDRTWI